MKTTRNPLLIALVCCGLIQACSGERSEDREVDAKLPANAATQAAPPRITAPCSLLADAEVREIVPSASAGKPDNSDAAAGIYACEWKTEAGRIWLQAYSSGPSTVDAEIHGLAAGLVDPTTKQVGDRIRIEDVADVGDAAMAFVEKADKAKGVLSSNAVLVTQRGEYTVALFAPELALADRDVALRGMRMLGGKVASRL